MMEAKVNGLLIVGALLCLGLGALIFFMTQWLLRYLSKAPGAVAKNIGEGVGQGLEGLGGGISSLAEGTGEAMAHVAGGAGNALEQVAESAGKSAETLAESCRRVLGHVWGIGEDALSRIPRKTYMSFTVTCEESRAINEWATASKRIKVTHIYEFVSKIGNIPILGMKSKIEQVQEYEVKAGIVLDAVCVEMPEDMEAGSVVYHVPKAKILSLTPISETYDTRTGKKLWESISDEDRKNAMEQLHEAAREMASHTDVLLLAERNVAQYLQKKHGELESLKDYPCMITYDALPTMMIHAESRSFGLSDALDSEFDPKLDPK